MKKFILCTMMLLLVLGTTGCKKEKIDITAENVTVNTLLARPNGELKTATVEDFDKSYYDVKELKKYIEDQIDSYNDVTGGKKITVESVQKNNGKAVMILSYSGMDQYAAFNKVTCAYFTGGEQEIPYSLPTTLLSAKGKNTDTNKVIANESLKILMITEPYNVVVEGTVK
ncbi:MAG: hypothetical protein WBI07_03965, partial [Mobilitalea sp.]